ncbi:phage head closure protein [Cupriavidus campinensis]|uniref:phage head closure protein n=1 Tax=Cupriavidus campinensis TaxID=151783 RepID=UPI002ADDE927|nr:phage head closure protein [Cupriavidus campinensis]
MTIQRRAGGQDALGQPATDWLDVATVWADVKHKSGLEVIRADSPASIVQASIRIRYRDDLNAGMRVACAGAMYAITAVMPDIDRREYIDLVCETGASDG